MNILERIQLLCEENNITVSKLEVELGLGKGTLYICSRHFHKNQQLILVHFLPLFFLFSTKKPGFRKY